MDEIINSQTGLRLRFINDYDQKNEDRLVIRARYAPFSQEPPIHFHPYQTEYFLVLEGKICFRIDGIVHLYNKGDAVVINANQRHSLWNPGEEPAEVDWQVVPAMDTREFLTEIFAVSNASVSNKKGQPSPFKSLYIVSKFSNTIRITGPIGILVKVLNFAIQQLRHLGIAKKYISYK